LTVPAGFARIAPYFFVAEPDAFIAFLERAFGAVTVGRTARPDGSLANAQIAIGGSNFMVSGATPAYPAMAAAYYLYVADADATMRSALAAGATLEMAVGDMPYGDRQGGVRDRAGNIWWISQRLTGDSYY